LVLVVIVFVYVRVFSCVYLRGRFPCPQKKPTPLRVGRGLSKNQRRDTY